MTQDEMHHLPALLILLIGICLAPTGAVASEAPGSLTPAPVVATVLRLAGVGLDDVLYDFGTDGTRIAQVAAARHGAQVNVAANDSAQRPLATHMFVNRRLHFLQGDPFDIDLSDADAVTLSLSQAGNVRLRSKLLAELEPGTPVISESTDMGAWKPDETVRVAGKTIYLWTIPAQVAGSWDLRIYNVPGRHRYRLNLQQEFQQVTGTVAFEGKAVPLRVVKLGGKKIFFTFTDVVDGVPALRQFTGIIDGDDIRSVEDRPDWEATRAAG